MNLTVRKLSILLAIPFLSACVNGVSVVSDNTTSVAAVSNMTSTSISFSCQKCAGTKTYSFNIKEEMSTTIKADVTIDDGSLTFTIKNADKEEIYSEKLNASANYEIPLNSTGKYQITINHDQFKGSYKLNWAK